jgi:hypothetical protein
MIPFEFIEDTFDKKNTSVYELSILLGMDSFVYMITDGQQQQQVLSQFPFRDQQHPYHSKHYPLEALEAYLNKHALLKARFRTVKLGIHSSLFTLIPERLYSEKDKKNLLIHLSETAALHEVRADQLGNLNSRLVYSLDRKLADLIKRHFSSARIFNMNSTMLLATHQLASQEREGYQFYLHVDGHYMRIFLFEGKNLLAATQNAYQAPQDLVYYVLLTFEQFRLSPADQPVFVCGSIHRDSDLYNQLYRYVQHIHYLKAPAFLQKGPQTKAIAEYQFFDLFSSLLLN